MFAVCGAELVAPYLKRMKEPNRDFRKAMYLIAFMTAFLTVFGTFSLSIFFDANNLPHDLKMNGSYYFRYCPSYLYDGTISRFLRLHQLGFGGRYC